MPFLFLRFRAACRAILAAGLAGLGACAAPPADQAQGTPAAQVATESLVSLQANGVSVGAAVAIGEGRFVTNAHVLRQASAGLELRRADGSEAVAARLLAISPRMDLAVLEIGRDFAHPAPRAAPLATRGPRPGEPVWAVGPQGLGRAVATGHVLRPRVEMQGFGPGFTAGLGAVMGFSGGPVVDGQGRVLGLTTALPAPGAAPVVAALTGLDLVGYAEGSRRQVFALDIQDVLAEARRLTAPVAVAGSWSPARNLLAARLGAGE